MKKFIAVLTLAMTMTLTGCGYKSGVSTGERQAYLYFTGSVDDVSVSVDDGKRFGVKPGRDNQYRILPGKHSVKVYRGDDLIVDREIYVGDGVAKEIGVH